MKLSVSLTEGVCKIFEAFVEQENELASFIYNSKAKQNWLS